MSVSLAYKIANQLNRACALEITTTAIETIEECLGEAMHTEKNLRLTSKIAEEAELKAAREEGRREGLREAIALLDERVASEHERARLATRDEEYSIRAMHSECAAAYGVAAKLLRKKVGNG